MNRLKIENVDTSTLGVIKTVTYPIVVIFYKFLEYANIDKKIVLALACAMVLDTITGFIAAKRLGIKPTSKVGKKGILIKMLFLFILLATAAIGQTLGLPLGELMRVIIILLTLFELYSSWGNYQTIVTREKVEEIDAVSFIIKYVREKLLELINKIIKK